MLFLVRVVIVVQFYSGIKPLKTHQGNKDMNGQKRLKRIVIYANDIQLITGKKYKGALGLLKRIKRSLNKSEDSLVTIDEFCIYTGIDREEIEHLLQD
ncbi:MAG: hypothetical protein ACTHJT_05775 [Cytophaga sp.]|uniref:hypothetical protein n=1 Tax=Cytophaga sp. TaxID=29535 RepID=UPI003F808E57